MTTSSGNLLVVAVSYDTSNTLVASVADTLGSSWSQARFINDAPGQQGLGLFYASTSGGSDTVTVTFGTSVTYRFLAISEYSGVNTLDGVSSNLATATTGKDVVSSTAASAAAGGISVGAVMDTSSGNTIKPGTGFTSRQNVGTNLNVEDKIPTATASPVAKWTFSAPHRYVAIQAVFKQSGTTPPPTTVPPTSPPPPSGWPDASNTGIDPNVTLTPYMGPMTITTPGTAIENQVISTDHGSLRIQASNVTLRNVKLLGTQLTIWDNTDTLEISGIVLDHLTVDGQGKGSTVNNDYAVGGGYGGGFTLSYSDISGWDTGVMINAVPANVNVHDNYVHGLGPASGVHKTALSTNGGGGNAVVRHNNLECAVSGCSAAMSLYGDFAVVSDWVVDNNLFNGGSYCTYGGTLPKKYPVADHIIWENNVYGRLFYAQCGIYGPETGWGSGNGNVWSNNTWADTGAQITP